MTTNAVSAGAFTGIPVIDIAPLVQADADPDAVATTAAQIGAACEAVGFFYVFNHAIPSADCDAVFDEAKRFFCLSDKEKMRLHIGDSTQFRGYVPLLGEVTAGRPDWHECIDLQPKWATPSGGALPLTEGRHPLDDPAQWPVALPSFRKVMMRAWDQRWQLAEKLASAMAISLGLSPDFFMAFTGGELCSLRMLHYPPVEHRLPPDDVESGFGAHCDYGFLAILQQCGVDGLEVRNADGEWIGAPHIPGTFLVNIGLMIQRWTNDRYRATWHRVRLVRDRDRYSIPFFFEPRMDAVVEPLPVCCNADNLPRYEKCVFGEMVTGLFTAAYGERPPETS